jgi:hypothetical protein
MKRKRKQRYQKSGGQRSTAEDITAAKRTTPNEAAKERCASSRTY